MASSAGRPEQQKHSLAAQFLLRAANVPSHLIREDFAQVQAIAKVPKALAEALVAAGARITYGQLVAAAADGIEGIETWAAAQINVSTLQGSNSGFSPVEELVCMGHQVPHPQQQGVNPQGVADLLLHALNACSHSHADSFGSLCQGPAAQQLTAAAFTDPFQRAIRLFCARNTRAPLARRYLIYLVAAISVTPASAMTVNEVMGVLEAAIHAFSSLGSNEQFADNAMCILCELPIAAQLTANEVCMLMRLAVSELAEPSEAPLLQSCLTYITTLPSAAEMDSTAVNQLIQDAVSSRLSVQSLLMLCQLVPEGDITEDITADTAAALLEAAVSAAVQRGPQATPTSKHLVSLLVWFASIHFDIDLRGCECIAKATLDAESDEDAGSRCACKHLISSLGSSWLPELEATGSALDRLVRLVLRLAARVIDNKTLLQWFVSRGAEVVVSEPASSVASLNITKEHCCQLLYVAMEIPDLHPWVDILCQQDSCQQLEYMHVYQLLYALKFLLDSKDSSVSVDMFERCRDSLLGLPAARKFPTDRVLSLLAWGILPKSHLDLLPPLEPPWRE